MKIATTPHAEDMRAYRRRLAAQGQHQFIAALPRETVAFLTNSSSAKACAAAVRHCCS